MNTIDNGSSKSFTLPIVYASWQNWWAVANDSVHVNILVIKHVPVYKVRHCFAVHQVWCSTFLSKEDAMAVIIFIYPPLSTPLRHIAGLFDVMVWSCKNIMPHLQAVVRPIQAKTGNSTDHTTAARFSLSLLKSRPAWDTHWGREQCASYRVTHHHCLYYRH